MPRYKRRSTVGGLDAPWNQALEQRTQANRGGVLSHRSIQGRKADGMNSRYDRMIATVNIMPTPESHNKRRRRSSSASGSSSLVSYDMPKTPVDAYNDLEGGRLGEDFAIIKMGQPRKERALQTSPAFSMNYFDDDPKEKEDIPAWLSTAMSNVGAHHPIRALIPKGKAHTSAVLAPGSSNLTSEAAPHPSPHINPSISFVDDDPFAFRVPSRGQDSPHIFPPAESENVFVKDHVSLPAYKQESQLTTSLLLEEHPKSSPRPSLHAMRSAPDTSIHCHSPSPNRNSPLEKPEFFSPGVLSSNMASPAHNRSSALPPPLDAADFAPFSIPGPFATYSANKLSRSMHHASSSPLCASSRIYTPPEPDTTPATDFTPVDAALPFSTPGPLARLLPPARSRSSTGHIGLQRSSDDVQNHLVSAQAILEPLDADYTFRSDLLLANNCLSTPGSRSRQPQLLSLKSHSSSTPVSTHIYFDSPAEDPLGSDPLDPEEYELNLDYDLLDFRWEKFDRSRTETYGPGCEMLRYVAAPDDRDEAPIEDDESIVDDSEASTSQQLGALDLRNVAQLSQSPTLTQNMEAVHEQPHLEGSAEHGTPEPTTVDDKENMPPESSQQGLSFAPAPGIFISPLRGDAPSEPDDTRAPQDDQEIKTNFDDAPIGTGKFESKMCDIDPEIDNSPRTPVNQTALLVPRTPTAPRNHRMSSQMSIPKIAVLSQKDVSDDEIDDPDGEACLQALRQVSQDSHDTIESWSGV